MNSLVPENYHHTVFQGIRFCKHSIFNYKNPVFSVLSSISSEVHTMRGIQPGNIANQVGALTWDTPTGEQRGLELLSLDSYAQQGSPELISDLWPLETQTDLRFLSLRDHQIRNIMPLSEIGHNLRVLSNDSVCQTEDIVDEYFGFRQARGQIIDLIPADLGRKMIKSGLGSGFLCLWRISLKGCIGNEGKQ